MMMMQTMPPGLLSVTVLVVGIAAVALATPANPGVTNPASMPPTT